MQESLKNYVDYDDYGGPTKSNATSPRQDDDINRMISPTATHLTKKLRKRQFQDTIRRVNDKLPEYSPPKKEDQADTRNKRRSKYSPLLPPHVFAALEVSHPYGVLPEGNRFLQQECTKEESKINNTSVQGILPDENWYRVLEFCSGRDLSRLVQACRYFYVMGMQPELWRDLVLNRCNQKQCDDHKNKKNDEDPTVLTSVGTSWRDTYVKQQTEAMKQNEVSNARKFVSHIPIPVPGMYSDYLYRLHSCRSFAIPEAWYTTKYDYAIRRVPVEEMTGHRFWSEFETPNVPVVIAGAAKSWKAFTRWQDESYCVQQTSRAKSSCFRATSGVAPLPGKFSLPAYYDYCHHTRHLEEAPLYLFDRTALSPGSELWKDYMQDLCRTCPYWDPHLDQPESETENDDMVGHDLFKLLGEGRRPDHTWLIVGPRRSGSVFHIDPNATHAWNATICGRKRWIFYPPGVTPPGVYPSRDGDQVTLPLSVGEWIFQFWSEHLDRMKKAPESERPMECTALPGDVLFVPHGWWHMVINLDEVNVAITHNYVSRSNLSSVLKFLNEKRDQVSGCRDRAESIKPESLYEEFVKQLQKTHPEWLEEAQAADWACPAWTNMAATGLGEQSAKKKANNHHSDSKQRNGAHPHVATIMEKAKVGDDTGSFSFSFL